MEKKKLLISLITNNSKEEYNLLGNYDSENKIIYYNENREIQTSMQIDLKNKILIRENKDIYIKYNFIDKKETSAIIRLKESNYETQVTIKTKKIVITDNKMSVVYKILDSNEIVNYEIEF